MWKNNTRRRFLKQVSMIAVASSPLPSVAIHRFFLAGRGKDDAADEIVKPVSFTDMQIGGELLMRAMKNYDRLEDEIYLPENDFNAGGASEGWPGDKEGRIILALTLQAQATHREPKYLDKIINLIPQHLNEKGYLGPVLANKIMEQQLSGHGWFLRGLCEYYEWKKDRRVKKYIHDIIYNLALPTRGYHKDYPIEPESRKREVGGAAGTTENTVGRWMLSSDIGCDFIFLDGIVQAYLLFPSKELKSLVEEMIARFLQMDLVAIAAQAHATLTALRGIVRYYTITGKPGLLAEAEKRYALYRTEAMTENYENFNWFKRPEWTESCAIIDSYMLAVQLWQYTQNQLYLEDAHKIYYNAICHVQRANGGFGLDNCPGPADDSLRVYLDEAHWCCTMRGGEGLASAIQYHYFPAKNALVVPFYNTSRCTFEFNNRKVLISQYSNYPFDNKVVFNVIDAEDPPGILFKLFTPSWAVNHQVKINDKMVPFESQNGFLSFLVTPGKGTTIELTFDQQIRVNDVVNKEHARPRYYSNSYGPLLLGYVGNEKITFHETPEITRQSEKEWKVNDKDILLSPVYHLMDPKVSKGDNYHKQILFKYS